MLYLNTIDRPAVYAIGNGQTAQFGLHDLPYALDCMHDQQALYDARGNGDGITAPTMTGDHQRRTTDYTVICIQESGREHAENIATALRAWDGA